VAASIDVVFDVLPDAQHGRKWVGSRALEGATGTAGFAQVTAIKSAVKLVIHKGGLLLADPGGVMEGEGRYSRSISFRSGDEIAPDVVTPICGRLRRADCDVIERRR
jgi:hypothetical protein